MQRYTGGISPSREVALDPPIYHHINSRIGTTTSLGSPSIHQRPGPNLPIESVKPEGQDESSRALSPEDEEKFKSQLLKIWERIMTFKKLPQWEKRISRKHKDMWLSWIIENTPVDVKLMLVSPDPPTPSQLKDLPWSNTTDGGVFVWCNEAIKEQDSTKKTTYVYVGSASDCRGGLMMRKIYMMAQLSVPHDESLKLKTKNFGLDEKGDFKELFRVPFKNDFAHDVMDVKALVILTRLVFMIWLGAVDEKLMPKVKDLIPWSLEDIQYFGLAGDNPLELEINEGKRLRK
jgi:hypothetical protein